MVEEKEWTRLVKESTGKEVKAPNPEIQTSKELP
jgi:hypothetical protein